MDVRKRLVLIAIALAVTATDASGQNAQTYQPTADDIAATRYVYQLVRRHHINRESIDRQITDHLLELYIEQLDPQRVYLLQSDIDKFIRSGSSLTDQLSKGDASFGFSIYKTFSERVARQIASVHQIVDSAHDFRIEESVTIDTGSLPFATNENELNERWRKRVKNALLTLMLARNGDDPRKRLHTRYDRLLKSVTEVDSRTILEQFLTAVTHCMDPNSTYMSTKTLDDFRVRSSLNLVGIGAAFRHENGNTVLALVVKGGPVERDGRLSPGDRVTAIAQGDNQFVDIEEMKLKDVTRLMRGRAGSKVQLEIVKPNGVESATYEFVRENVDLPESVVRGTIIDVSRRMKLKGRVGVIDIPAFYRDFAGAQAGTKDFKSSARDVQKVMTEFQQQGGVDVVIVDLRHNGGGALSEAIEVTGLFIDEGPVVQVRGAGNTVKTYSDVSKGAYNEPLIVVCNRVTASGSEIFAGAIRDYRRGIIVGDTTTAGNGTIQNVMPVAPPLFFRKSYGALKLTINQFYRLTGDSTQTVGVKSDIVLPSVLDHMKAGETLPTNSLPFHKIAPTQLQSLTYVNEKVLSQLKTASQNRITASSGFSEIKQEIQSYHETRQQSKISLNAAKRVAIRNAITADHSDPASIFPASTYNDELMKIAVNYVTLLQSAYSTK
jgi:carboxyl-terminal processing protease